MSTGKRAEGNAFGAEAAGAMKQARDGLEQMVEEMRPAVPPAVSGPEEWEWARGRSEKALRAYAGLLDEASRETARLFHYHRSSVTCTRGCSACCENISVLPIEWYALLRWLRRNRRYIVSSLRPRREGENRCPFLHRMDGSCCLYPARPLICRLHGLPIRYPVEEYDLVGQPVLCSPREWTFSWCDHNFPGIEPGQAEAVFAPGEYIDMEYWKGELTRLNREFLSGSLAAEVPAAGDWLPLSSLPL
jgi:Fe-S-cluster containining protein